MDHAEHATPENRGDQLRYAAEHGIRPTPAGQATWGEVGPFSRHAYDNAGNEVPWPEEGIAGVGADPHGAGGATADPHDSESGGVRQDGEPTMHDFQPGVFRPGLCKYPGCGQPEGAHEVDGEEARGPFGPRMPGVNDLPSYTLFGQILKRFGR